MLLVYGSVDNLTPKQDILRLQNILPSHTETILMEDYNHVDVVWSEFAYIELHPQVVQFLLKK
jgi:hypothetical protein